MSLTNIAVGGRRKTYISSLPYSLTARATNASTSSAFRVSHLTKIAFPPIFSISCTVVVFSSGTPFPVLSGVSRRSETTTWAPSRTYARAVARPIPEAAPVIIAVLEVRRLGILVRGDVGVDVVRSGVDGSGRGWPDWKGGMWR
jgi:hypothetical protein